MSALTDIQTRIKNAAAIAGHNPADIRLIAVSKTRSLQAVKALAAEGQIDFAENTVQDAETKTPFCNELSWHFIGHLQSNKTKYIPALFDWVHSIDSFKLVRRIDEAAREEGKKINILLQVNTAHDDNKAGIDPAQLFPLVEQILAASFEHILVRGLMTIGRRHATPIQARQTFIDLRNLMETASIEFGHKYFSELSMGMSGDFEMAIEEGATMVRIGTALFGERKG
ncbi:MAG: YggS family pyridoxal phosphate-dependent enzyme [Gammaproteobacteria bacterium]